MTCVLNITSQEEVQKLRRLALSVPESVIVRSMGGEIALNAKSPMGIYAMDFSKPVQVISESQVLMDALRNW